MCANQEESKALYDREEDQLSEEGGQLLESHGILLAAKKNSSSAKKKKLRALFQRANPQPNDGTHHTGLSADMADCRIDATPQKRFKSPVGPDRRARRRD